MSVDESHIFQHRGKKGQTLTFPDSTAAKAWAHDLVLVSPASRAGDTNRQRQRQEETIVGNS